MSAEKLGKLFQSPLGFLELDPLEMARQLTLYDHQLYFELGAKEFLNQGRLNGVMSEKYFVDTSTFSCTRLTGWEKAGKLTNSPNITKLIRSTNNVGCWLWYRGLINVRQLQYHHHHQQISYLVASTIVSNADLRVRVDLIKYFVLVAARCREMNNFHTLTSLIGGLSMGPCYRMTKTWKVGRGRM